MAASFQLKQAKNKQHFFNLLDSNGEVILTSEMYSSRPPRRRASPRFRGTHPSETYNSAAAMEKGIKSVIKNGKASKVVDLST